MASRGFAYVWQYAIEPTRRTDFVKAYAPGGDWTQLFSRDPSYLGTVLYQDTDDQDRYVTIDYWQSRQDRDAFRERYSVDFETLDKRCEAFTKEERFLGDFIELKGTSS